MRDLMTVGAVPCDESCEQLGPNYNSAQARKECEVYIGQLERQFPQVVESGAYFKIDPQPHDFGVYYEVGVVYNNDSDEQIKAAYFVESESPTTWDEIARQELGL